MAEVSVRTSQNDVGAPVAKKATSRFDVRSWQGLTKLLKAGKESGMSPEAYAEFRDLVLSYAGGGGTDKDLESKITSLTTSFGIQAESAIESKSVQKLKVQSDVLHREPETVTGNAYAEVRKTSKSFGISRARPQFGTQEVLTKEEKERQEVPHNLPTVTPPPKSEIEKAAPAPTPVRTTVEQVEKSEVVEKKEPAPQPPVSVTANTAPQSVEDYKARILEIKHTVNAQVGNPVSLVDEGNPVGRGYMSALLSAMKAVNGVAPGTLISSMQELEAMFKKIMALPAKGAVFQKETGSADVPAPVEQEKPAEVVTEIKSVPQKIQPPILKKQEVTPIPEEKVIPATPSVSTKSVRSVPTGSHVIPSLSSDGEVSKKRLEPESVDSLPISQMATKEASTEIRESHEVSTKTQVAVEPARPKIQIGEKNSVPLGVTDDANTPQIDIGLNQLLSEWKLFQSSGVFGTGSGGHEHPLYKKLAPLPMSMIMSGSWEGAQKEVLFSIRDYVGGWLHEQGVAYLPDESFEHYLRRVVKRILRRQEAR